ncbi:S-adenosyl-L-methionine-dependent methyltransferase [Hesseltinella vesiculosa]|uniref:S-adenosyl-L-methionine-dependent methyltransferase n=1 Tax=Hesseltinella vesiculosa TaxID=101127 RepID=A0A1X2GEW3_9FUNG|nr:S-adenosyl-L-methionine-dependent methyltransferase [Hesseltinella vesiculosa]
MAGVQFKISLPSPPQDPGHTSHSDCSSCSFQKSVMTTFAKSSFDALSYMNFRPSYNKLAMQSFLQHHHGDRLLAVDLGCGPGTATLLLTDCFDQVIGIDPSDSMLVTARSTAKAKGITNVDFVQGSDHKLPLADHSVDLLTIAQSLHWFDPTLFLPEAKRVLKPSGTLVAWGYMYGEIDGHSDLLRQLGRHTTLADYWEPGRTIAEGGCISWLPLFQQYFGHVQHFSYPTKLTPMSQIQHPPWMDPSELTYPGLVQYTKTWSCYKNWKDDPANANQPDVIDAFFQANLRHTSESTYRIQWPHSIILAQFE